MSDQKTDRDEIQKKIDEILSKSADGGYIFRGEPGLYKEDPYLGRVSSNLWREYFAKDDDINDDNVENVVEEMLSDAKYHSGRRPKELHDDPLSRALEESLEKNADFELLMEIQHYGGKTNLIDFSEDYSVALFFACEKNIDKDGRVILQKKRELIEKGMIAYPEKPRHRVIAQKSVFVKPPKGYIPNLNNSNEDMIVIIPKFLKGPIQVWLKDNHDIDVGSIYNDVHGFIAYQDTHAAFYLNFFKGVAHSDRGDGVNDQENQ